MLGLPSSDVGLTLIGLAMLGVAASAIFAPLLTEVIEAVEEKEKGQFHHHTSHINDKATALFSTAGALGTIIAPILGGVMNDQLGFARTCDILAISALISGAIYFFFMAITCES